MKTNLLFFTIIISALSVNAQITITTSDMPVSGQSYITANDTNVTSFGSAGTNQTWNFAGWANHSKDTASFVNPSSLPGFSNFPTATLGLGDDNSVFLKNSSTSFDILGFYGDFGVGPMPIVFTPAQKFLSFPSNYLTSYTGSSKYELKVYINQSGIDSMKVKHAVNYSSTIDAWGAITTPAFANVNSLRQKYTEIAVDTTYFTLTSAPTTWVLDPNPSIDTTNSYKWWSNTKKMPVAEITANGDNIVTAASYLTSLTVGVNEKLIAKNELNVFPNPASDKVNIAGISTESYLLILDVNGKLMEKSMLKKSSVSINTSAYENGTYFYQVVSMSGNTIGKGKFVVSK